MTTRRRWLWSCHDDARSCFMMMMIIIITTILQLRISNSWPRSRFTIFLCRHNDEHIQGQSSLISVFSSRITVLPRFSVAGADDPKELGGHSEASPCPGEELQVACLCSTGHRSFMSFMECFMVETLADEFWHDSSLVQLMNSSFESKWRKKSRCPPIQNPEQTTQKCNLFLR